MKRVVVIGAGISGLVAAASLVQKGYEVVVLESRDRVGGRTLSKIFHNHAYDLGGQFVSKTHTRLVAWIKRLGLNLEPVHRAAHLLDIAQLESQTFHYDPLRNQGLPEFEDPETTRDLEQAVEKLDAMARALPLKPWKSPEAEALDFMTTKELFEKVAQTSLARAFLTSFFESLLCFEPVQISALCFLDYLRSGGYFSVLHGIDENGAQSFFIREGAQSICLRLADALGDRVHLSQTVKQIVWQTSNGVCRVTANDHSWDCEVVLVTVPPVLYSTLGFQPSLPKEKMILSTRMDLGATIKTLTFYSRPFWREKNLSGVSDNDNGIITESYDGSFGDAYVLIGFICARQAQIWMQKSQRVRKQAILQHYAKTFGDKTALKPIFYDEMEWNDQEFSGGAFVGISSIGTYSHFGHALQTCYPPVYFAGAETAKHFKGYMAGAVETAENVVKSIVKDLTSV